VAVSVTFVIGCVVGGASSRLAAQPRPAPAYTRWEYNCFNTPFQTTDKANELGAQGWEMVAGAGAGGGASSVSHFETFIWCFKRPAR
jgi:hypothetical protein